MSKFTKILLSIAALGVTATLASMGSFATFTDTASTSETSNPTYSTGTVNVNLGATGVDNRLSVGATGLVPGDSLQRRVKLTNAGSENLASITLSTTASTSSLLDTDATDGLQMEIEKCGGLLGWAETAVGSGYTYTCDQLLAGDDLGARTTVFTRAAVIQTTAALSSMSALTAAATDDMVVTLDLPSTADNTFQNISSVIDFDFIATQRNGTSK